MSLQALCATPRCNWDASSSGRSFLGNCQKRDGELSPDVVVLLEISGFPSVNQCLVPVHCSVFGLILKKREGVGAFWI